MMIFEKWQKQKPTHPGTPMKRPTDRHIRVKRLKIKDKENILEEAGEKVSLTMKPSQMNG